jgi:hypothetical protein
MEEKEMLMELEPDIFFETDHYKGWPAVLARLSRMDSDMLRHRLECAWRHRAPKRVVAAYDATSDSALAAQLSCCGASPLAVIGTSGAWASRSVV